MPVKSKGATHYCGHVSDGGAVHVIDDNTFSMFTIFGSDEQKPTALCGTELKRFLVAPCVNDKGQRRSGYVPFGVAVTWKKMPNFCKRCLAKVDADA